MIVRVLLLQGHDKWDKGLATVVMGGANLVLHVDLPDPPQTLNRNDDERLDRRINTMTYPQQVQPPNASLYDCRTFIFQGLHHLRNTDLLPM